MIVRQDSGDWRGPWRQVTPGRMPIGWPQGREGNAEDPFFWRSRRGFHVLFVKEWCFLDLFDGPSRQP